MSAKTLAASIELDTKLRNVVKCAEELAKNSVTSKGAHTFQGEERDLTNLEAAIENFRNADKAFVELMASENR